MFLSDIGFSPSPSPSLPLSLKMNTYMKSLKTQKIKMGPVLSGVAVCLGSLVAKCPGAARAHSWECLGRATLPD